MNGTILIVDDEVEICVLLSTYFDMLGYATECTGNGREALEVLSQKHIDIVISDIMMPQMDGISLLREVRHQYPMIRVIMITGYITLENALTCMRLKAETCVFKPLDDLSELKDAVNDAMVSLDRWKQKFHELQGMKNAENRGLR